ncbi:hypothetical protein C3E79_05995 [Corynebacterium liangguodongii]|uniref:Uncharacterized protein n=1 Tax=Corynebacterium liangguodongii TaxID=2079535 RepID=A0A2S0WEC8_9CORY|nr:hypothetical protein C3E79_05995 [Corynebacterium liangguodongii]PWC00095.1 hypothetical protein DF219_02635 [Corynebacterium liangguodongii]
MQLNDDSTGTPINHTQFARSVRSLKLFGYTRKRKVSTTVSVQKKPVFLDLVRRRSTTPQPNCFYAGASPTCRFRMGLICAWRRFSPAILTDSPGSAIAGHMRTSLVQDVLLMARGQRSSLNSAIFRPDHGSVYTPHGLQDTCRQLGIRQSMVRQGWQQC